MTHPSQFDDPCRYLITDVWGDMVGRLHCADVLVDNRRHEDDGTTSWTLVTGTTVSGGMAGHYVGDWQPPHQDAIDVLVTEMKACQASARHARREVSALRSGDGRLHVIWKPASPPDVHGQRTSAQAYARARDLYESIQVLRKAQS